MHCGSEPTWIYLPEEPDYSKHRPEPEDFGEEAGDSEAESDDAPVEVQEEVQEEEEQEEAAPVESKEAEAAREKEEQEKLMQQRASELLQLQTAAARRRKGQRAAAAEAARAEAEEKAEEGESSASSEAWGKWKPAKKDRLKGTPARVEPEGDLHQHRYGKVPAKARKSQDTPPIPEESPPRPRKAKKSRDTSPPEESPRSRPRVERQIYLPPHRREPKDAPSEGKVDTKRTRPAEPGWHSRRHHHRLLVLRTFHLTRSRRRRSQARFQSRRRHPGSPSRRLPRSTFHHTFVQRRVAQRRLRRRPLPIVFRRPLAPCSWVRC